jgi:hypothetical protein
MPLSTSHYGNRVSEYWVVIPLKRDTMTENENENEETTKKYNSRADPIQSARPISQPWLWWDYSGPY